MFEKRQVKIVVAVAAMLIVVALIQATPLAFLPHSTDDFIQGCAAGIIIALVIAWLVSRHGSVKE